MKRFKAFAVILLAVVVPLAIYYLYGLYQLGQLDAAIGTVRVLGEAETKFAENHPDRGYSCSFSELDSGGGAIKELGRTGKWQGCAFEIRDCQPIAGKPSRNYFIVARCPRGDVVCADQSKIIRYEPSDCNKP